MAPTDLKLLAQQTFQVALSLHRSGQLEQARQHFEETLRLQPNHVQTLVLLAALHLELANPEEALGLTKRALKLDPRSIAAHVTAGQANSRLDRSTAAIASYDAALALNPLLANVHLRRGTELHKIKRYEAALGSFDRAIACSVDFAAAHYNRGVLLSDLGRHREALGSYDRAIAIQPEHADAHLNRGSALSNLGELDAALASYDRAIMLQGDSVMALANRAQALAQLQRLDEAIASSDRAIALQPDHADAYLHRGVALSYLNQWDRALDSYERAIALRPDHVRAHLNKSLALLTIGDYENGWTEYQWRLKDSGHPSPADAIFAQPLWQGTECLRDRTILLYSEGGLGDTIQFCRYVRWVSDLGANVILHVQPPLYSLLHSLTAPVHIVTPAHDLPHFDYRCPLMSLPWAFKTTLSSIPARVPYLYAEREKIRDWEALLGERHKRRVGLVWSGGFRPHQPQFWSIDRRRNIRLQELAVLKHPDIEFYSLQKGEPAESELANLISGGWAGLELRDFTAHLHDFSDTAALIENLDLVISVDTAVAHLAAALGKPTWILNRFDSCWRWLADRVDSPWYPTVRLYKQGAFGDWSGVVERVRRDLFT